MLLPGGMGRSYGDARWHPMSCSHQLDLYTPSTETTGPSALRSGVTIDNIFTNFFAQRMVSSRRRATRLVSIGGAIASRHSRQKS